MNRDDRLFASIFDRTPQELPLFDGFIPMQSVLDPVHYRIKACFMPAVTERQAQDLAMQVCHISCMTVEILRYRQPGSILTKFAEQECIARIERMRALLAECMHDLTIMHRRKIYPPVELKWINGMLKSESLFDVSVSFRIGGRIYLGTLVFVRKGRRWLCRQVDIG